MAVDVSTDIVHPLRYGDLPPIEPIILGKSLPRMGADRLAEQWAEEGYILPRSNASRPSFDVPRTYLVRLPNDLGEIADIDERKSLFIRIVLPMALRANDIIRQHRRAIDKLAAKRKSGKLDSNEARWLEDIAAFYEVSGNDLATLRQRANPIPVSLAIAQAAAESGWGTSRFALQGNALFGQWIWGGRGGLTPKKRAANKNHRIKTFPNLINSVWNYVHNLNTHPAYGGLRRQRAGSANQNISGAALAGQLEAYSEKGMAYVVLLREIISQNRLGQLDRIARLTPLPTS